MHYIDLAATASLAEQRDVIGTQIKQFERDNTFLNDLAQQRVFVPVMKEFLAMAMAIRSRDSEGPPGEPGRKQPIVGVLGASSLPQIVKSGGIEATITQSGRLPPQALQQDDVVRLETTRDG